MPHPVSITPQIQPCLSLRVGKESKVKKISGEGKVLAIQGYQCFLLVSRDEIISIKNQHDSQKDFYKAHSHKNLFEGQAESN